VHLVGFITRIGSHMNKPSHLNRHPITPTWSVHCSNDFISSVFHSSKIPFRAEYRHVTKKIVIKLRMLKKRMPMKIFGLIDMR